MGGVGGKTSSSSCGDLSPTDDVVVLLTRSESMGLLSSSSLSALGEMDPGAPASMDVAGLERVESSVSGREGEVVPDLMYSS